MKKVVVAIVLGIAVTACGTQANQASDVQTVEIGSAEHKILQAYELEMEKNGASFLSLVKSSVAASTLAKISELEKNSQKISLHVTGYDYLTYSKEGSQSFTITFYTPSTPDANTVDEGKSEAKSIIIELKSKVKVSESVQSVKSLELINIKFALPYFVYSV